MSLPEYPIDRKEMYLQNIATGEGDLPEYPTDPKEQYLEYIALNGGGGGGGGGIPAPASPSAGDFLVYDGSAWVAQTLAAWQGGSY